MCVCVCARVRACVRARSCVEASIWKWCGVKERGEILMLRAHQLFLLDSDNSLALLLT
jgi:hypothetical protein